MYVKLLKTVENLKNPVSIKKKINAVIVEKFLKKEQ